MFTLGRCQLGRSPEPQGLWPNAGEEAAQQQAVRGPAILGDGSASSGVTESARTQGSWPVSALGGLVDLL